MATDDLYLVLEIYHNANEYTSIDGRLATIRAVCFSLPDAAEIIGKKKVQEVQKLVDGYNSTGTAGSFTQNLFVVKVTPNTYLDVMNEPRINVTESDLTEATRNQ